MNLFHLWRFFILMLLLAACAEPPGPQDSAQLPTVASLPSLTPSETGTPQTPTATATASLTPTFTETASVTPTETVTVTPSTTITDTPTPTQTATITNTPYQGPLFFLAQAAAQATILPQNIVLPTPDAQSAVVLPGTSPTTDAAVNTNCTEQPPGGFGSLYFNNAGLVSQIGCMVGGVSTLNSAVQNFERGNMIWLSGPIYVLYADGRYQLYTDTFVEGVDPASGGESPPAGLIEPIRGFGKIWRITPEVRNGIGWGTTQESGGSAVVQRFERGMMIDMTQRSDILVLIDNGSGVGGTWQSYAGNF